jgi:UDP-N-acetyl-D-glucosamine dehydrogenase
MRFNNYATRFIPLAEEINQSMPAHVVRLVVEALNQRKRCLNGARILCLGVAYKRGVGDTRESPALQILASLLERGGIVAYADPYVPTLEIAGKEYTSRDVTEAELDQADCILILTDHPDFKYREIVASGNLIVDTRDATWGIPAPSGQVVRL